MFGYGEERSEIDATLVEEVIDDLDATGVLGPRSDANRLESVVPVEAAAHVRVTPEPAEARQPEAPPAGRRTAEDERLARELAELASELKRREQEMAIRERELAEQRRVLADQYRLLKAQAQPPVAAAGAPVWPPAGAAVKPPLTYGAVRQPQARAFNTYHTKRRSSLWRRVKNTLLGTPEPALEDSL